MSQQDRLVALATAIGADVKSLQSSLNSLPSTAAPARAGTRTKPYDKERFIYNRTDTLRRQLKYALGKAFANDAFIPCSFIGDSATMGWGSLAISTRDPVSQIKTMLKELGYPITGDWVFPWMGQTPGDTRWVSTGTWSTGGVTTAAPGSISNHYIWTSQSGATATFSSKDTGTIAEVLMFSASNVNVTVSIDGGTGQTYAIVANAQTPFKVTGLSNATHTIKVTTTSAATVWLCGARVRQTTGLSLTNAGIFGATADQWLPNASSSVGYNPFNLSQTSIGDTNAIVFMALGGNNAIHSGYTPAALTTNLVTIGNAIKAKGSVLVMHGYSDGPPNTIETANPGTTSQDWYRAMLDAADQLDCMFIDHLEANGPYASIQAANLLYTDNQHLTASGYNMHARNIVRALQTA